MRKMLCSRLSSWHSLVRPCALVLLLVPAVTEARPLWCSPFESESGAAVSQDQIASEVDNLVGEPGQATGSVANLPSLLYVGHGVYVPGVPAGIDPAGQAGAFTLSTPDHRGTGINTNLRSDAGDLANNLTFEGYFFMPSDAPITSPTFVGRRLVTQKRSALDDNSRLAIGIHAETALVGYQDGLFEREVFDYPVPGDPIALAGLSGGTGWGGAWVNSTNTFFVASGSLSSDASPFTSAGGRLTAPGGASAVAARALSRSVDLGQDGNTLYFSALMRKNNNDGATARNLEVVFTPTSTSTQTIRFGMTSAGAWFITPAGGTQTSGGTVVPNTTYFVIGKIVSSAGSPDQCFLQVYSPTDAPPTTEPGTWLVSNTLSSATVLQNIRLVAGTSIVGEFDEFRVGSTWESVTDPDAAMGNPGQIQTRNLLSVYWAEPDAVPPAVINHLELGTTTLAANTWYHFALTYDGTDLRWYLNGQQEGEVLGPNLTGVGTAKMVLANARSTGTNDRGFYGLIDEVRIWDKVLTPAEMLVNGGLPGANLLWNSRFETQFGQPVTNGLAADALNCIDNSAGAPSGSPAGIVASIYTGYGQTNVPAIPAGINPGNLGGSFVISMPDQPNPAVNTRIPSNSGNLASAVTVQGYFNTFRTLPVGVASLGSRLVSMMRSASEGSARLAIGLVANDDVTPTHNVLGIIWADTGSVLTVVRGANAIQPNTWYHFALVYDGTDIRFYLNGQLEGQVLAPPLIAPGSAPIAIGNDRTTGTGTRGFYGLLDKIVISDHVIAPEQFMTAGFDPCLGLWCNTPFADFDDDDDVDMDDFAEFQLCYTGDLIGLSSGCACFDRDESDTIDGDDLAEFILCQTRASVAWAPELTPGCNP